MGLGVGTRAADRSSALTVGYMSRSAKGLKSESLRGVTSLRGEVGRADAPYPALLVARVEQVPSGRSDSKVT